MIIGQSGRLESKSNDFLPRNFYDKVREIAESTYKSKWTDPLNPAVIDRKWQAFPTSGAKVINQFDLSQLPSQFKHGRSSMIL